MRKINELTTSNSCLNRADLSEPLFVLRSTDVDAPELVRRWAREYRDRKEREGHWNERCNNKWEEAIKLSYEMEEWRQNKERLKLLDVEGCSQSKG